MDRRERQELILGLVRNCDILSTGDLAARLAASPATVQRDLQRMTREGMVERVHGGVRLAPGLEIRDSTCAVARAAAALLLPGESLLLGGGAATERMSRHLAGLKLEVFTNSLKILNAILPYPDVRIHLPSGAVFREQDVILGFGSAREAQPLQQRLFIGAGAVVEKGVAEPDPLQAAAARDLIARAAHVVLLAESSKFQDGSGHLVCALDKVGTVVTDCGLAEEHRARLRRAGAEIVFARTS